MTTYLVIKRMKEDRLFMPGETVVDIDRADRLVQRGYLIVVPDDYEQKKAGAQAEATARTSVQQALDMGYSEKAAKHIAAGTKEEDLPKYVKEEREKIVARQELREKRTPAELDRLAIILGTTAEGVLDLDDDDYAKVLDENPSSAGTAASDAAEVGKDHSDDLPPYEALMALPKDGLLANLAEKNIQEPGLEDWFENDEIRAAVVREILTAAGYSGEALQPRATETDETKQPE